MELEDRYPGEVRDYERIIRHDPDRAKALFPSPDRMADHLRPDSAYNHILYDVLDLDAGRYLRITSKALMAALTRKGNRQRWEQRQVQMAERRQQRGVEDAQAKEDARKQRTQARQAEMEDILTTAIGGYPMNEREFISLKMQHDGVTMSFDRVFRNRKGEIIRGEQIGLDLHLTAADYALVKPRGDHLSATNIDRALAEWCLAQREAALEQVMQRVLTLPADSALTAMEIFDKFRTVCGYYFKDAPFAATAMMSAFWQVKRMMMGLPVAQRYMFVYLGGQNCGKSFLQRLIMEAIKEVVAEASLRDVLDERQMDLPNFAVILLDELVAADRADSASLKNFITGVEWSRRPMRTNITEKIKLRATLFGTSNHSLGKLIYDSSGMRRFVELEVRPRHEIEAHWDEIINFDWLAIWQAVDVYAECPLLVEYPDVLRAKQEELRNPENTETWMMGFEPHHSHTVKERSNLYTDYYGSDLYEEFRQWEQSYDRGYRGTSLNRWGRDMKSLIDQGHVTDWSYFKVGPKTIYRRHRAVDAPHGENTVHTLREMINHRR